MASRQFSILEFRFINLYNHISLMYAFIISSHQINLYHMSQIETVSFIVKQYMQHLPISCALPLQPIATLAIQNTKFQTLISTVQSNPTPSKSMNHISNPQHHLSANHTTPFFSYINKQTPPSFTNTTTLPLLFSPKI